MENSEKILVCFAVKEEAGPFRKGIDSSGRIQVLVTGMGERNTRMTVKPALSSEVPGLVLTCGFAGGLRPGLSSGVVLYECEGLPELASQLEKAGAKAGKFAFASVVATTVVEKRRLWEQTRADAVEMESHLIQLMCKERNIPCATVRVILDAAEEDLPLNFNALMTEDQKLSYAKLIGALLRSPAKIGGLLTLQRQSGEAAGKLGSVLVSFCKHSPPHVGGEKA